MPQANIVQTSISGGYSNALAMQGDGIFFPKLDTTSRTSLSLTASDAGLMVYDTTLKNVFVWTGSDWESVPGSGDSLNRQVIFNDGGVLAGDAGLTYDKAQARLNVGPALYLWLGASQFATNLGIGFNTLAATGAGAAGNVAVGYTAGRYISSGANNIAVGAGTLSGSNANQITGLQNVAVGVQAMLVATTNSNNVALGALACSSMSSGDYNVAIGSGSAFFKTSGSSNIMIGAFSETETPTSSNQLSIGSASNWVATNGGPNTYYPSAGGGAIPPIAGSIGFMRVMLNGTMRKLPVFPD